MAKRSELSLSATPGVLHIFGGKAPAGGEFFLADDVYLSVLREGDYLSVHRFPIVTSLQDESDFISPEREGDYLSIHRRGAYISIEDIES